MSRIEGAHRCVPHIAPNFQEKKSQYSHLTFQVN